MLPLTYCMLACLVLLAQFPAIAQQVAAKYHEVAMRLDNDAFLLQGKDGYYSSGTFLAYRHARLKNDRKILGDFTVGLQMFTTRERHTYGRGHVPFDRPYCGYLYAGYTRYLFRHKDEQIGLGARVGVVGEWSQASNVQLWLHNAMDLYYYNFWKGQIPNEIGVDLTFSYARALFRTQKETNGLGLLAGGDARLGTFFMEARPAIWLVGGKMSDLQNSALLNASAGRQWSTKNRYELFAFFKPEIVMQGYNVTIQGGRFNPPNTKMNWDSIMGVKYIAVSKPVPIVYMQTIGIVYARRRYSLRAEYVFQTREAASQEQPQQYGALQFGYCF